jgi:hypothetical protein
MRRLHALAIHVLHVVSLALAIGMAAYGGVRLATYVGAHTSSEDQDARRCRERDGMPTFGWHGMLTDCRPLPVRR